MVVQKFNYQRINLTEKEREAISTTKEILNYFQKNYSEDIILQSEQNGDLIFIEELARVRGILNFFEERNQIVSVKERR